ncbi:MAG: DUF4286 family protein [Flavobacteriaceae bacterium]|nr:DUF4286 family protein [Flavobacteriaceae bacterium]
MYIYNVTTNIEESIHEEWKAWMQEKHIPDMLATGKFSKVLMSRVQVEEEMGGFTFSVQYTTDSKETLNKYYQEDANRLRKEALQRFPNQFGAFRTELEKFIK